MRLRRPKLKDFEVIVRVLVKEKGGWPGYVCQRVPDGWACGHCTFPIEAKYNYKCGNCGARVRAIERIIDWESLKAAERLYFERMNEMQRCNQGA